MRKLLNEELGRKTVEQYKQSDKIPVIVVLDNIRSALNVGSVFRTADGFLLEGIYLCGITARPPHKEMNKTALGATESVDWKYFDNTIDAIKKLKDNGYIIVAVEQVEDSVMLQDFYPEKGKKYALVFGNEVNGVMQEAVDLSDYAVEIPQFGTKHSFNISVSAGIVLWEFVRKIGFPSHN